VYEKYRQDTPGKLKLIEIRNIMIDVTIRFKKQLDHVEIVPNKKKKCVLMVLI